MFLQECPRNFLGNSSISFSDILLDVSPLIFLAISSNVLPEVSRKVLQRVVLENSLRTFFSENPLRCSSESSSRCFHKNSYIRELFQILLSGIPEILLDLSEVPPQKTSKISLIFFQNFSHLQIFRMFLREYFQMYRG